MPEVNLAENSPLTTLYASLLTAILFSIVEGKALNPGKGLSLPVAFSKLSANCTFELEIVLTRNTASCAIEQLLIKE